MSKLVLYVSVKQSELLESLLARFCFLIMLNALTENVVVSSCYSNIMYECVVDCS
jgi:hypothetical protein